MLKYVIIGIVILVVIIWLRKMFGRRTNEPFAQDQPKMLPRDDGAVAAEIEGQELDIDSTVLGEVRALADQGRTIEAIARLREATGLDLARAKDIVESLVRMRSR